MDGRIIIKRQAFHKGKWKNIQALKRSTNPICGNNYFSKAEIKPSHSSIFAVPCIEGSIETKFRLIVSLKNGTTIFSNEFDGMIDKELLE